MGRVLSTKTVLRYTVDRGKDSRINYTSALTLNDLKKKYGDKLLEVVEYQRVGVVHHAERPGS